MLLSLELSEARLVLTLLERTHQDWHRLARNKIRGLCLTLAALSRPQRTLWPSWGGLLTTVQGKDAANGRHLSAMAFLLFQLTDVTSDDVVKHQTEPVAQ